MCKANDWHKAAALIESGSYLDASSEVQSITQNTCMYVHLYIHVHVNTLNPVYLTLLNFLKTCVLTFIIITISQCVLVRKHTVPSDYYCQMRISL